MTNTPLVSIIIPTYNRAHLIGETLDSVLAQTYTNWECIVVDDGSNDNTAEVMAAYCTKDARFQYYHRPKERMPGGNAARNYGFEVSKGEYVQWFDSDDVMCENVLKLQLEHVLKSKQKISVCLYTVYNANFNVIQKQDKPNILRDNAYYDFISAYIKVNLQTTLWHRSVVSGFKLNEDLKKSQEYDFIQRVFKNNYKDVTFNNIPLIKIRAHDYSITGSFFSGTDDKKIADSLNVKLAVLRDLPSDCPTEVKQDLVRFYLRVLYNVFKFKKTRLFYRYLLLLKSEVKGFNYITQFKLLGVYCIYFFTNKGSQYYKRLTGIT
ncbi:glycosyltransferase family 2 protein [Formosa sp. A9]|uniref:glycosyltransferase family 2 protein n=1 Tax=Formosa sp. A9 TaxID=3442641 RepID=UPI003EBFEA3A